MKAVMHVTGTEHQRQHAEAMAAGLARHGVDVRYGSWGQPEPCDFAVCWGVRQRRLFGAGHPVLVMERGHVGNRMVLASCGWDGLGRRGRYPKAIDGGARWRLRHAHLMRPWTFRDGYALVIGQVEGDAALRGLDVAAWREQACRHLAGLGWEIRYRPHPLTETPTTTLAADLAGAGMCVTYNSTAGVEAVLAGVPTVTLDAGAMAWDVTSHTLGLKRWANRDAWAWDLAWSQWTVEEIAHGDAWAALAPIMEAA